MRSNQQQAMDHPSTTSRNNNGPIQQYSRKSPGTTLGSVAYGMLRKTKNKTYSALRGTSSQYGPAGALRAPSECTHVVGGARETNLGDYITQPLTADDLDTSTTRDADGDSGDGREGDGGATPPMASLAKARIGESVESILVSRSSQPDLSVVQDEDDMRGRKPNQSLPSSAFNIFRYFSRIESFNGVTRSIDSVGVDQIVRRVESSLRKIVFSCVLFLAGSMMPESAPAVNKILELSFVAWGTCFVIIALAWVHSTRRWMGRINQQSAVQQPVPNSMASSLLGNRSLQHEGQTKEGPVPYEVEKMMIVKKRFSDLAAPNNSSHLSNLSSTITSTTGRNQKRTHEEVACHDLRPPSKVMRESPTPFEASQSQQLNDLYIIHLETQERIYPNGSLTKLDNDLFEGEMLLLIRTPDVDQPHNDSFRPNNSASNHFRGKQRRFEFQWQLRLKKCPPGEVFMGCELDEPIRLGMIQRALVNTALKFVKKMNQGFSYFLSDSGDSFSFMAFPVGTSMDRFVATKSGEQLPELGTELIEDPDALKKRKKGAKINWNTETVYTMALWSAYFDWIDWQCLNFPGIRPFSATSVAGTQPVRLTLYTIPSVANDVLPEKIGEARELVLALELSNASKSSLGSMAKMWEANHLLSGKENDDDDDVTHRPDEDISLEESCERTERDNFESSIRFSEENNTYALCSENENIHDLDDQCEEEERLFVVTADAEEFAEDEVTDVDGAINNVEADSYLRSGLPISLREGTGSYVASGGGYAVLQSSPSFLIVLEKIAQPKRPFSKNQKNGATRRNSTVIRFGDAVRVKLIEHSGADSPKIVKYLSIHRGWWLKWVSFRPKKNGSFYIRANGSDCGFVTYGDPFLLGNRRWSNYLIGVCTESSAKFGGRMLGIFKTGKSSMDDEPEYVEEDDGALQENEAYDTDFQVGKCRDSRMMPLLLCAEAIGRSNKNSPSSSSPIRKSTSRVSQASFAEDALSSLPGETKTDQHQKYYHVDVPAWIEMMNRTKRTKQLVYLIRIKENSSSPNEGNLQNNYIESKLTHVDIFDHNLKDSSSRVHANNVEQGSRQLSHTNDDHVFIKLRSGQDLAPILQLGFESNREISSSNHLMQIANLQVGDGGGSREQRFEFPDQEQIHNVDSFSSSSDDSDSEEEPSDFLIAGPNHSGLHTTFGVTSGDGNYMKSLSDEQSVEKEAGSSEDRDAQARTATDQPATDQGPKHSVSNVAPHIRMLTSFAEHENGVVTASDNSKKKGRVFNIKRSTSKGNRRKSVDALALLENDYGYLRTRSLSIEYPKGEKNYQDISPLDGGGQSDTVPITPKFDPHYGRNVAGADSEDSDRKQRKSDCEEGRLDGTLSIPSVPDLEPIEGIENKKKNRIKHSAVLGRVAKTVKSSTVITGKHVIKHGKKVGKGTVSAGRAAGRVIPAPSTVYPYKQPGKHEPGGRVRASRGRKKLSKDHIVAVNRAMKKIKDQGNFFAEINAGQLLPPDQSCRKVSQILSEISSNHSHAVLDAISSLVKSTSSQDSSFLRGSSAELGVVPFKPLDSKFDSDCIVARCIWEGHWREELCVLYARAKYCAFYAPLTKKPNLILNFEEILSVRRCQPTDNSNPLPGLHLLSIDTTWRCHYLAFLEENQKESFFARLNNALFYTNNDGQFSSPWKSSNINGGNSRDSESPLLLMETSLAHSVGKWAPVSVGKKAKQKKPRIILNDRRMPFDFELLTGSKEGEMGKRNIQEKLAKYVENLLRTALSFSPDKLGGDQSNFISFLDEVSRLRSLPINKIDLFSKEAFCIFVNLYHCLLQHALLLLEYELPNKRSFTVFKRCSCYEIGGDVFSLSELECYVIRGKTSHAKHLKSPFVEAPKKSRAHRRYALGATDHRVNFILNNGDLAYPACVPVFQSQIIEEQIDTASSCFLTDQVQIDVRRRTVVLPKVCDVFRNDFGMGDGLVCLSQCLRYLDDLDQLKIAALLDDGSSPIAVKFRAPCDKYHSNLTILH